MKPKQMLMIGGKPRATISQLLSDGDVQLFGAADKGQIRYHPSDFAYGHDIQMKLEDPDEPLPRNRAERRAIAREAFSDRVAVQEGKFLLSKKKVEPR